MPFLSFLGEMLKSGKVTVSANNVDTVEISATDNKINIKALDKAFVKDTLAAASSAQEDKGIKGALNKIKTARDGLEQLKGVAEELSEAGLTVTLSYKGNVVITLGSEANPRLSSAATGTKAIEINNPRRLIELVI
jgi:hypothetical protein